MYDYRYSSDPSVRIGDAEREATGERLRNAHAEGRLDPEEFQERLDRCLKAKVAGDLDALVIDLPGGRAVPPSAGVGAGAAGDPPPLLARLRLMPILPIVLAVVLVSSIVHGHVLWVLLPLFFLSRFLFGPRWYRRGRGYAPWQQL